MLTCTLEAASGPCGGEQRCPRVFAGRWASVALGAALALSGASVAAAQDTINNISIKGLYGYESKLSIMPSTPSLTYTWSCAERDQTCTSDTPGSNANSVLSVGTTIVMKSPDGYWYGYHVESVTSDDEFEREKNVLTFSGQTMVEEMRQVTSSNVYVLDGGLPAKLVSGTGVDIGLSADSSGLTTSGDLDVTGDVTATGDVGAVNIVASADVDGVDLTASDQVTAYRAYINALESDSVLNTVPLQIWYGSLNLTTPLSGTAKALEIIGYVAYDTGGYPFGTHHLFSVQDNLTGYILDLQANDDTPNDTYLLDVAANSRFTKNMNHPSFDANLYDGVKIGYTDSGALLLMDDASSTSTARAGLQTYNDGGTWWTTLTDGGTDQAADGRLRLGTLEASGTIYVPEVEGTAYTTFALHNVAQNAAGTGVLMASGTATHATGDVAMVKIAPTINTGDVAGNPSYTGLKIMPDYSNGDPDAVNTGLWIGEDDGTNERYALYLDSFGGSYNGSNLYIGGNRNGNQYKVASLGVDGMRIGYGSSGSAKALITPAANQGMVMFDGNSYAISTNSSAGFLNADISWSRYNDGSNTWMSVDAGPGSGTYNQAGGRIRATVAKISFLQEFGTSLDWGLSSGLIYGPNTGGAAIDSAVSSSTDPAHTFRGDYDTGVGRDNADELVLIAGGTAIAEARKDGSSNPVLDLASILSIHERSSDPAAPAEGECIVWLSDGTGKGDDGDLMVACTAASTTNYGTLFDHSTGASW